MTELATADASSDQPAFEPFLALDGRSERVRAVVEPVLFAEGCELVNLVVVTGQKQAQVKVFVDLSEDRLASEESAPATEDGNAEETLEAADGAQTIGLAVLTKINRLLGDVLDVEDQAQSLFRGSYVLEVSSPGLDRPLAKRSHFPRAVGQVVKIRSRAVIASGKGVTGKLVVSDDDGIAVLPTGGAEDSEPLRVSFGDIESAHILYSFDEPGQKGRGKTKRRDKKAQK